MAVTVTHVQRAAPDILVARILDGPIAHGELVDLSAYDSSTEWAQGETTGTLADMSSAAYDTSTTIDGMTGYVVGPNKDTFRTVTTPPSEYLDRTAIKNAAGYGTIDGHSVTSVYFENRQYDEGYESGEAAQLEHFVYLHLDGIPEDGGYTIEWPAATEGGKSEVPADTDFTLADKTTVCPFIHLNQNGYGLSDEVRHAQFDGRIPGYENGTDIASVFDPRDYSAWTGNAYIIDVHGVVRYTINAEYRIGPTDMEDDGPFFSEYNYWTPSQNEKTDIVGITKGSPTVFETDGAHGLANDDEVFIAGVLGMNNINTFRIGETYYPATVVDPTHFSIAYDSSSQPDYTSGGAAHRVYRMNSGGTHIWNLDFDDFDGPVGDYRIWVPGFGVSPTFRIDDAVWARLADYCFRGTVAHYSGVALDDRFGYERPQDHRPTASGGNITVLQSTVPVSWSSEGDLVDIINFPDAGQAPYITTTERDYWGGLHDAGDWDRRYQHLGIAEFLLSVYELTDPSGSSSFNVPKMSTLVTDGTYDSVDALPDPVQSAMWIIDFFRRTQLPNGSICGGVEMTAGPRDYEPSWKARFTIFAYSHDDPLAAYSYARAAAFLAKVLDDEGYSSLAATYQTSAVAAWDWAESNYSDLDTLWADLITDATNEGEFASTSWATYKSTIEPSIYRTDNFGGLRTMAASALYRLIDDSEYKDIVEGWWTGGGSGGGYAPSWQNYHYLRTDHAGVSSSIQASMLSLMTSTAASTLTNTHGNADSCYPDCGFSNTQGYTGYGLRSCPTLPAAQILIWCHYFAGSDVYIETLLRGVGLVMGVNPLNYCLVNGLGQDNPKCLLHEDSRAMGRRPPDGVCSYGWLHWRAWKAAFTNGAVSFAQWPQPAGAITTGDAEYRLIEPEVSFQPARRYLPNSWTAIPAMEYTNHQTHGVLAGIGYYLCAVRGGDFTFNTPQVRKTLHFSSAP